jgi:hypothetical protein
MICIGHTDEYCVDTFCMLCPPYLTCWVTFLMNCCCFFPFLFFMPKVLSCSQRNTSTHAWYTVHVVTFIPINAHFCIAQLSPNSTELEQFKARPQWVYPSSFLRSFYSLLAAAAASLEASRSRSRHAILRDFGLVRGRQTTSFQRY